VRAYADEAAEFFVMHYFVYLMFLIKNYMKIKIAFVLLIAFGLVSMTTKGPEELFKNESKLADCRQEIPLTYKKKDDQKVAEIAKTLKDKELILLHYDKKTSEITYRRYYLVSQVKGNNTYNFLIGKSDYLSHKNVAVFLKYSDKCDRFYAADCFDKIVADNSDLKELLKEKS